MERAIDIDAAAAASALIWWADAGVDTLVDEQPRNWLKPRPVIPAKAGTQPDIAEAQPEALPEQLGLFEGWLRDSDTLPYAAPGARRVCPSGDPASGLMILAGMPEAQDCDSNTLLSGDAGRLFDRMLAAIGRDRGSVYLAALSCLRSPDGRLAGEQATQCAALARHHVGLVQPKALLLFGDAPAKALLGLSSIQARGRWHDLATHVGPVKTLVTLSPDSLLRQPAHKAYAWADLQMLCEGLEG